MSATHKSRKLFYPVQIRRRFKNDLWLIESRATAGIENEPRISQLDVAGIVWLDHATEDACGKGSLSSARDPVTGSWCRVPEIREQSRAILPRMESAVAVQTKGRRERL